ncbi:uncharacterized protein [Chanodichthys erythropterus]|uniref:uncharacterized protein isoform X1 n=2 Tax=Chanodichthys erythropterus TaxID=933992 RepID=UPI00351F3321
MLKSKRRKTPLQDAEDHMTHRTDKPGLQEQFISKYKGRGVFTTRAFFRGDFVLEYRGELLSSEESLDRTEHYTEAENAFLFDFQWRGRNWCMDASKEDGSLGRLVNDEHRNPTCKMRTLEVSSKPHLCLFAVRDILPGEEITYNYGDSDWPWRVKPLNQASTESSDKKPSISLGPQRSPHCAAPVSSPGLDEVNSSGPHKQSGKARTSRKTKRFQSRLAKLRKHHEDCYERFNRAETEKERNKIAKSSLVVSTTDASSSSPPCAVSTSVMTSSTSPPPAPPTSPAQPSSSSSSPAQPSSSSSSPAQLSSTSSSPAQPSSSSSSPSQPSSSSSSPAQPSSSSSSPAQPPSSPAPPLSSPCAVSTPVVLSSQMSKTLSLREVPSLRLSRKRQYSGSAISDYSDVTDYSDVDYIPKINSDESDGSSSGHDMGKSALMHPKSLKEAGSSSNQFVTAPSPKKMKCQTKETNTLSGDKTFIQSMPSPKQECKTYKKKQYCLYCSKPYSKMARHLEFVHRNEVEVVKAVAYPKNSKERRVQLNHLRKRGNFAHNTDVVRQGHGEMIACYRPKKGKRAKEFIHCIYCQGLYNKSSLWKHIKTCPLKPKDDEAQGRKRVRSLCALNTPVGLEVSTGFKKVLSFMNYDDVSRVVHSDICIMQLGQHMFNRMGSDVTRHDYIRQKMREVGRLLLEARKFTPLRTMVDFIIPANFKHVIAAVKVVSGYDEEKNFYRIPSLALKLGHSLNKICSIVESNAMMYGDHDRAECARDFRKIHQARWNEYISAGAITTLKEAKWNTPQIIPFTQDVKVLHAHLDKKHNELLSKLRTCPSADSYAALAKVTLSQVILFNRRREGEVSRMLLSAFKSRDSSELHKDIAICLSEFERKLCLHFTRVEIRGKRGRKVPVLLKPSMVTAMELLVETREVCGVPAENPFMFARCGAMSAYRGGECINKAACECGIKNPEALSSTRLRKHIATMSKVLNLDENEADQLADFLGHDIRIHRQYYRLPEGTLQLAKMSKVLMAMEKGTLSDFKGKKLDDIEIDPNEQLEAQGDSMSSDEEDYSDVSQTTAPAETDPPVQSDQSVSQEDQGSSNAPKKKWEDNEVKAVERHMMKFIKTCKVPGKQDCERCIHAEPEALKQRTWTGVKNYVRNRITTLKRKGGL